MIEVQTGLKIKVFRTDNGGEYTSDDVKNLCGKFGIVHQLTVTHSPQQNGVCERKNMTIMEMARCMIFEFFLPKFPWAEAINFCISAQ